MKKVFLVVGKALSSFAVWAGRFGCIVVVLAIVLVVHRFVMPAVSNWSTVTVSADTIVTGVRKMSKLKPYKVITAGFANEVRKDGKENAELYYQYKGMVEFEVDLSEMKVNIDGDAMEVRLNRPSIGKPFMLSMPTNSLWHANGSAKMKEQFLKDRGKIIAQRMCQDADTPENLKKAKDQTELILRAMFIPTGIDPSKIKFEWRDGTSSQQN